MKYRTLNRSEVKNLLKENFKSISVLYLHRIGMYTAQCFSLQLIDLELDFFDSKRNRTGMKLGLAE